MTRAYRSSLREEQAEATRKRIVDALVAQTAEVGRADFSIAEVAERAGVAERTVYRYFPTREAMLDAINREADTGARAIAMRDPADMVEHFHALFAWFEANPQLVEASHVSNVGREVRAHGRRVRGERTRQILAAMLPDVDDEVRLRAFAAFRTMFGSMTWRTMRHELGLTADQTRDAVEWVLRLVLDDLARQQRAAKAARTKPRTRKGAGS